MTRPSASASRRVAGLSPTSTIRALPRASTWERRRLSAMVDALRMQVCHTALGLFVVLFGVDIEEGIGAQEVLELILLQYVSPNPLQQVQHRLVPRHEHALDGCDATAGVDATQRPLRVVVPRNGDVGVLGRGGGKHPLQDLAVQEGEIHSQDQALVEAGVAQPRQNAAEGSRLKD